MKLDGALLEILVRALPLLTSNKRLQALADYSFELRQRRKRDRNMAVAFLSLDFEDLFNIQNRERAEVG